MKPNFILLFFFLTGFIPPPMDGQQSISADDPDSAPDFIWHAGAIIRGGTSEQTIALVFTGDEYGEGGEEIMKVLQQQKIPASFFLTGNFYRNPDFRDLIRALRKDGHYLGAHSDRHLLYCDWTKRDSLLVTREEFIRDLEENYRAMFKFGIDKPDAPYFLPPYEWYNDSIAAWTRTMGFHLVNYTPGTLSHADYTAPGTQGYRDSREIYSSIIDYERVSPHGLNGFILLMHIGTVEERGDKFYLYLEPLLVELKSKGYSFVTIKELLNEI